MKKLYILFFAVISLTAAAQSSMTFSSTPDSANQTPRPGSTGSFVIQYQGGVYTNSSYYSICCQSSKSSALDLYRFNINIPAGATVTGVSVSYTNPGGNGGNANYKIDSLCLINNFTKISNFKRDSVNGTNQLYSNGSANDTWGAALSPAVVNAPHFGFRIFMDTYGINTTVLGAFNLTVHYSASAGLKANTGDGIRPLVYCTNKELHVKQAVQASAKLTLISLTGEKVSEFTIEDKDAKIDLNLLAPGIYIYKYCSDLQSVSSKIIVE